MKLTKSQTFYLLQQRKHFISYYFLFFSKWQPLAETKHNLRPSMLRMHARLRRAFGPEKKKNLNPPEQINDEHSLKPSLDVSTVKLSLLCKFYNFQANILIYFVVFIPFELSNERIEGKYYLRVCIFQTEI